MFLKVFLLNKLFHSKGISNNFNGNDFKSPQTESDLCRFQKKVKFFAKTMLDVCFLHIKLLLLCREIIINNYKND